MKEKKYSISEASRLLEVENHVLRYWEDELELNIPRNELGHRYYREQEIQLLYCIKELKNKGFQLKAVKEVLPDLEEKQMIDVHKLLVTQVELENMEAMQEEQKKREMPENTLEQEARIPSEYEEEEEVGENKVVSLRKNEDSRKVHSFPVRQESASIRNNEEKMQEFENIMGRIIGRALHDQAENLSDAMSERICNRVAREIDEALLDQEERTEAYFKKLDETIRTHQRTRQEIAVARDDGGRKKSRFFQKNKRKI